MSTMGVDVGTTGCKAGVFDSEGNLRALAYREYPLVSPEPGWAEIDSAQVCRLCLEAIREAAGAWREDPVRALGISCQGEAFTPIDGDGNILGNAMVSSDARAAGLVGPWSDRFGRDRLYQVTGHTPHPMFTIFKLLWLKQNRPEVWKAARRFLCFEELVQSRLGIQPAISWPLAGRTMMFNVRTHQWDGDILAAVELDSSRLARPLPSGEVVDTIPRSVAESLGLPEGVKVVAGGHDQPCGALGAGVVTPGRAMYATGTVECICPAFDRPILDEALFRNNLCTYDYTIPGTYTTVAFSLTGGNLLKWFRDQWAAVEVEHARRSGADPYDLLLAQMPTEPSDLLVLPYFTPSGTPNFDAETPGAIVGLRLSSTRPQVLRALLEGVAMEMRLNVEILDAAGLRIDEFLAIGGGAKNPALTQLKADVLGRPITTLSVTEAACLGAAMLAAAADQGASPRQLVETWVKPTSVVEPDNRRASVYSERFTSYKELYPTIKEFTRKSRTTA
ncbi:MAG: hypothetical protein HUU20_10715 [Pirellulales bacterium]|nr:hypothetical protein [Pirellulales bacterium]